MYLAHIPVNHHLRSLYRALAALCGLFLVGIGIYGIVETNGLELFAQENLPEVLGHRLNPASAGMIAVFGVVILAVTAIGRNLDHLGNFWLGQILVIVAMLSMAFLRTDANVLGFNMTSVIVFMTVGLLVFTSSMYAKIGPDRPNDEGRQDTRDVQHPRAHV
jgi:Na+/melibiose symporter-like transporter